MSSKQSYVKSVALLLCSIVLFSSFGFTLNMHLCQGEVKAISLLGEAQKCVEMKESDVCNSKNSPVSLTKRNVVQRLQSKLKVQLKTSPLLLITFKTLF